MTNNKHAQHRHREPPSPSSASSSSASNASASPTTTNNMITLDNSGSIKRSAPELQNATSPAPCITTEDVAASILSDAQRSAQSELRSTSEILKLAGVVLNRDRSGSGGRLSPTKTSMMPMPSPRQSPAAAANAILRNRVASPSSSGIETYLTLPPLSIQPSLSSSPLSSPPPSPAFTIDDSIHLPGKFGSLSSAEVKKKLTSSPIKRTELLSKLDGLDRVVVPSSSSILSDAGSAKSDELVSKVARSSTAVSEAMENAHAHANRIKENNSLTMKRPRAISIGNNASFTSSPKNTNSSSSTINTLSLSSLAIDQSVHARMSTKSSQCKLMPLWVKRKISAERGNKDNNNASASSKNNRSTTDNNEYFGQYESHSSETVMTHEFNRGNWTWATEWSPDGKYLAMATENHGLAIVEAGMSTSIWKVVHDERMGKLKNDTTHTIRSIAWGANFIALGGTGDAVSIVEPCLSEIDSTSSSSSSSSSGSRKQYSFEVVDVITETGFVGSLSWLKNSNILAIGNREDQCLIAHIRRGEDGSVTSNILHNIQRTDWVNAVRFSHGGTKLAIGDRSGLLSVYFFVMIRPGEPPALSPLQNVQMEDNILDVQWSTDGKILYTGGEDYSITILDTAKYSILHRIGRDRWVTFLAPSRGGSYLAAGGMSGLVSLLDVNKKWEDVTSLPVDGGMTLSATWHPKDEYLAICGQFNDVVVYESSCKRLPRGKCLRSASSILAVEFSPDGNMIAVGGETGLVTIFDAASPTFVTLYQTVIGIGGDMAVKWSPDGQYVAIASGSTFVLLDTSLCPGMDTMHPQSSARFLVRKIIQSGASFSALSFSPGSQYMALADDQTRILDLKNDCSCVRVLDQSACSAWSDDGSCFAMVGGRSYLSIYDVKSSPSPENWRLLFSISFKATIRSLCWGPPVKKGLQYLAFGGANKTVAIFEIRTHEQIWETVLSIPCKSQINDLDWNSKGMLCVGDDDGIVSVVDLSYLKSGKTVSEMNYNWQRQGVISQTKLTRNLGRNAITSLCWRPSDGMPSNQNFLATGGSDGVFEIVDLSGRGCMK